MSARLAIGAALTATAARRVAATEAFIVIDWFGSGLRLYVESGDYKIRCVVFGMMGTQMTNMGDLYVSLLMESPGAILLTPSWMRTIGRYLLRSNGWGFRRGGQSVGHFIPRVLDECDRASYTVFVPTPARLSPCQRPTIRAYREYVWHFPSMGVSPRSPRTTTSHTL